ncbi:MAG: T9SS type A sorting domain-containing protein [Rhodothermaceae bacterium]|nr:T9SS type A sorting domain-containing protein [Rhodothermaceae bacterium]MYD18981.1 T9SS type A sorting domain-containing protein [Rhodothermaceae bacterium]MYD56867.1 T9SS type A sorting domain-containing protein [Rhodothermaceae bacterium]MYI42698.1 T9SS type A sorting domain-containing protein [Rhodothermaceae bacterium]MYJ56918.1 T9SS type A sorting domain-containing protein [Rhodothermaceae bacterium]
MRTIIAALLAVFITLAPSREAAAQLDDVESRPEVTVTDHDIEAGDTVRWTADNVYILDGLVIVEEGATLHIDAGTVIKAEEGTGPDASALVIARGGKIFADGTLTQPIIFTAFQDNISSPDLLTNEDPDRGLWGGIVILGQAGTNNPGDAAGDYKEVEGVNELLPDGDTRAEYGGSVDDDDSGVMRYVSIRHTGINIGESDGNEIQGLTLGGVGAGTVLEHIEVFASGDDGVEFFGGTVNLKYFVSAFNSDDAIDWDQGWRGKGQFWFVLQGTDKAGAAAEQDGAGGDEHFQPFAIPKIYNVTYVGPGSDASPESDRGEMLMFRDNSGGFYHNSIFTQFNTDKGGHAIQIEDIDNTGSKTEDSRQRFETGDLGLTHNIWWDFGSGTSPQDWIAGSDPAFVTAVLTYLQANGNAIEDPKLRGIDRGPTGTGLLDPRPHGNSPAFTLPRADYPDGDQFFSETDYIGAFGRENWLFGWTALDQLGYSVPTSIEQVSVAEIPSEISLTQNYPNPFNPVTTVEFDLDRAQNVTLSVLDVTGRQVAVLVDDQKSAGTFRVQFDASYLPSGLYLYRLNTQTESLTRKMTLLK